MRFLIVQSDTSTIAALVGGFATLIALVGIIVRWLLAHVTRLHKDNRADMKEIAITFSSAVDRQTEAMIGLTNELRADIKWRESARNELGHQT